MAAAASAPTETAGLEQLRHRSNKAALRQRRISTSNTCNLDWPSVDPDRPSTSQLHTQTMGVLKQLSRASDFYGVPLINSPEPMPDGEQALKCLCFCIPCMCHAIRISWVLCPPYGHLSLFHWKLPDHWPEPNSPFLQNSSICKFGNLAGQGCSQSPSHYWSKLMLLKCHTFRRHSHVSIKSVIGFCVQSHSRKHFLIATNGYPGRNMSVFVIYINHVIPQIYFCIKKIPRS